jgi:hypothetical protein
MRLRGVPFVAAALALAGCDETFAFTDPLDDDAGALDAAAEVVVEASVPTCVANGCPSTLRCNTTTGSCDECQSSGDCAFPYAWCDPSLHQCFECLTDADCHGFESCVTKVHKCVPRCSPGTGMCPAGGFCDPTTLLCTYCRTDAQCKDPQHTQCERDVFNCFECTADNQCPMTHPHCDLASFRCVMCVRSSDCPALHPFCEPGHHVCIDG